MPRTPLIAIKTIAACTLTTGANAVFAHEGHGLSGSHWHATDLWGYVVIGVVLAVAIWQGRQ